MEQPCIDPSSVHRILIVGLSALGDTLVATPVLRALRTAFPRSSITYFSTGSVTHELFRNNPDVDECIVGKGLKEVLPMQPFDLAVDLFGSKASQMMCMLSGARYRVGRRPPEPIFKLESYNIATPAASEGNHVLTDFLRVTRGLRLPDPPLKTVFILDETEREFARAFLERCGLGQGDRWLGLQPGRKHDPPPWSEDKFVALTRKLLHKFGYPILIFQGPKDRTAHAVEICKKLASQAVLVPLLPIRHYAAVLERCALLVASEGGAGHIAAALGVRTVVIFTAPWKSYWFPYRREDGMVALEELPAGNLTVQDVFSAAEGLLTENCKIL